MPDQKPFAIVTGASAGIGYELARLAAMDGYDLLIAADRDMSKATSDLRALGATVETVQADLATTEGVDKLVAAAKGRAVDVLCANAGHGLGHGFLDQDWKEARHVVDMNVTGTIYLIHQIGRSMRQRNAGRILITGSIAGFMPGSYQAVYNGTKAFIDSFGFALREELRGSNVTVTILMPGATETEFFERAHMQDTQVGSAKKDDPVFVAGVGWDAMKRGDGDVVSGWKNKVQSTMANVLPAGVTAAMHRRMAQPGGASGSGTGTAMKAVLGVTAGAVGLLALTTLIGGRHDTRVESWQRTGRRAGEQTGRRARRLARQAAEQTERGAEAGRRALHSWR